MDKGQACEIAIDNINKATKMKSYHRDEKEANKIVTDYYDIPEGIKETAIREINNLHYYGLNAYSVYHGQDEVADYIFYLSFRNGKIILVKEIDYGMTYHHYYTDAEEILYGFSIIESLKPVLENVEIVRKVK